MVYNGAVRTPELVVDLCTLGSPVLCFLKECGQDLSFGNADTHLSSAGIRFSRLALYGLGPKDKTLVMGFCYRYHPSFTNSQSSYPEGRCALHLFS